MTLAKLHTESNTDRKRITIPATAEHCGDMQLQLDVEWKCLKCGGPRGEIFDTVSWDGSLTLACHGWTNPCGHVEKYSDVRAAAGLEGGAA